MSGSDGVKTGPGMGGNGPRGCTALQEVHLPKVAHTYSISTPPHPCATAMAPWRENTSCNITAMTDKR